MAPSAPAWLARFIGDAARPYTLVASASAASWVTINVPFHPGVSLAEAAIYIGAAWAPVVALYGSKVYEERTRAKANAEVHVARAQAQGLDAPVNHD